MGKNYRFFVLLIAACTPDPGTESSTGTPSTGQETTTTTTPTTGEPDSTTAPEVTTTGGTTTEATDVTTTAATTGGTTDDPTTGGTTEEATTGDATTGEQTTGPVCLEHTIADPREYPEELVLGCQLSELCPGEGPMEFQKDGDQWTTNDLDRGHCMVTAMRERTIGTLRYQEGMEADLDSYTIEIHGEQVSLRHIREGFGFDYAYEERVTFLREPAFFTACIAGDANAVHECLEDGFTDECATELECPR
jgi:hypothetical protein